MQKHKILSGLILVLTTILFAAPAIAADLYLNSPLDTAYYQSDANIIAQNGCIVPTSGKVKGQALNLTGSIDPTAQRI